jgi:glycosyltransferase involved in cell wall biosynthesis
MRILTLTPWFPAFPGDQSGSFVYDSMVSMQSLGHEVKALVSQPWRPQIAGRFSRDWSRDRLKVALFDASLGVEEVQHPSIPRNYLKGISNAMYRRRVAPALRRIIASFDPDLVHAHTELPACVAVEVAKDLGKPTVVTLHGINTAAKLNTTKQLMFQRRWLSQADRIILVGKPLIEHFEAIVGRSDHFTVVANGLRLSHSSQSLGAGNWSNPIQLVSLSNLHEGKGVDITLRALKKLRTQGINDWSYKIVGDGSQRDYLEHLTDSLELRDQVRFVGGCHQHEVYNHLNGCDVFVLPSYREAFGIAYLEAMAVGLLAIGVSGQGPEAFILHRETGLMVQPRSVDSLYACLRDVLANPLEMQRIATQGKIYVQNNFTLEHHAKRLAKVYREAIDGSK